MSHAQGTTELAELGEHWQRWATLVAQFARGRKRRHPISSADYRELHGQLLQACQAAVGVVDKSKQPSLQQIETLVRPWVTVDAIVGAGQKNAVRLLGQCQQLNVLFRGLPAKSRTAQAAIGGGGKSSLFILLVAFALGIGITLAVLYWDDVSPRMSPKYDAQLWLVWLKFKVQHFGFFKVFSVITIVTIIIGSLLMYATKKS